MAPQAWHPLQSTAFSKGRVERAWGTLQDRLVSELRLAQACTREDANTILARYRGDHNGRFALPPQERTPAWRPLPRGLDLERVCSFGYEATVLKDNTVRLGGLILDIPPGPRRRSYADERVEVRQLLDGSWRIYAADRLIGSGPVTAFRDLHRRRRRKAGRGAAQAGPAPALWLEAPA